MIELSETIDAFGFAAMSPQSVNKVKEPHVKVAGLSRRERIMIMVQGEVTFGAFHESQAPEWVAIRNVALQNVRCDFILVGGGKRFEHFEEGRILFYNVGSGDKIRFALSTFLRFALPLLLRPSVVVDVGGITSLIPSGTASFFIRARFVSAVVGSIRNGLSVFPKGTKRIFSFLLKSTLKKACAILAISESIKKEIIDDCEINSKNIFVYRLKISNIFNPCVSKDLRAFLNPHGPIVLTVARISPEKGLHYLVEASRIIVKKIPSVKFVFQPYSSEERYKKRLLSSISRYGLQRHFTIFAESVPYSEMPKYMAASDLFVLPSLSEGIPMVILEAMASGVPVVASGVGGIPEILVHGRNGLIVEPGDVEGLAKSVMMVLLDEELRKKLSEGALETIEKSRENEFESLINRLAAAGCRSSAD